MTFQVLPPFYSKVCEAVPRSLFWAPNRFTELLEVCFEFPSILSGKWAITSLLTGQSWHVIKSWYTGEGQEQGFWHCFTDRPNQSLDLSVVQARFSITCTNSVRASRLQFECSYFLAMSLNVIIMVVIVQNLPLCFTKKQSSHHFLNLE